MLSFFNINASLLGVPLGIVEARLMRQLFRREGWIVGLVAIDVASLALIGESAQLWLPARESSLIDLVALTIGGTAAAQLFVTLVRPSNPDAFQSQPADELDGSRRHESEGHDES